MEDYKQSLFEENKLGFRLFFLLLQGDSKDFLMIGFAHML